jgi:uncharacterized protein (DUF1800 family)
MDNAAAIAAIRFGLGRTPSQPVGSDPQWWLLGQLKEVDAGPPAATVMDAFTALLRDREARLARKETSTAQPQPRVGQPFAGQGQPSLSREIYRTDSQALLDYALSTQTPFRERLVWFWANHFTVSLRSGQVAPLIGSYVREAIRPHVTGRFSDMLLAVMRHPAMLIYLDNAQSAGPDSVLGARQHRGLNENLARECLELHTVSPAAGYTQADVTSFAAILTGWSVERRENPLGFRFRPGLAEPGEKVLMGRQFPEGEQGGLMALAFLADHPATHRHLATKLVTHFVSDTPPVDAVRRIEAVLRDTRGDLGAAAAEITRLPAAWQPLSKIKSPQELVVAAFRAAGVAPGPKTNLIGLIGGLGQPVFNAPLPNGWPDNAAEWAGPEALLRRVDWAYGFANRPELPEPMAFADAALGPLLSASTAAQIQRAGSRRDAITLLIASPEFQRR